MKSKIKEVNPYLASIGAKEFKSMNQTNGLFHKVFKNIKRLFTY